MKLVGSSKAVRSPEFHKRKVIESRLRITAALFVLLVIVLGPIFLLRYSKFVISNIEISGNEVTHEEVIQKIVSENLSGNYWKVLPKASILLYPNEKIESDILAAVARISSVDVSRTGTRSIRISVVERKPHALYCASRCYFLDDTGYIFSEAPNFFGNVYMTYADAAIDNPLRTQLFGPNQLKAIERFLAKAKDLGIQLDVLTREGNEFVLSQKAGPVIKWNEDQNLEELIVNLESFLKNGGFKAEEIANMTYIDLRFGNKVFYKFQGE